MNLLLGSSLRPARFAATASGRGSVGAPIVRANTDSFRLPTEEEAREQALREDAQISVAVAVLLLLTADLLWLVLSLVLLEDFRPAIIAFVAVDAGLVWVIRKQSRAGNALIVARGLAGVAWFAVETAVFGAPISLPIGQLLLLLAAAVLSFGRGGEGKIALGIVLGLVGLIVAFALAFAQKQADETGKQSKIREVFELASVGRTADAVEAMGALLEQHKDDAWTHMAAAEFYISDSVRDLDRALELARRALELAPGDLKVLANLVLAEVRQARGEFQDAIAAVDEAVNLDKKNPIVHMTRAQLLVEAGRRQEAVQDYRKVEELAPNSEIAQAARLERLQIEGPSRSRITAPAS